MPRRIVAWLALAALMAGPAPAAPECSATRLTMKAPPLTGEPFVELTLDGRTGPWLVDFGTTRSVVSAAIWKDLKPGDAVDLSGFSFPGVPAAPRTFRVDEGLGLRPGIGVPHGIVGTDLLKAVTTELHFEEAGGFYAVFTPSTCARPVRTEAGFFPLDQTGFFGREPPLRRPNVPVATIELEERAIDKAHPVLPRPRHGGRTWAQIDTGYADAFWPYSIDVNVPYLKRLKALVPQLARVGLIPVSGCGGEASTREVYAAPGWKLNIVLADGKPLPTRWFDSFVFIVKPEATSCGGIGSLAEPAAQLGSSFLRAFGTTIFEPSTSTVWIRTP